jgi:anthranilate synthase component 1
VRDCTLEHFVSLAGSLKGARVVPVWREILFDNDTAVSAFARIREEPFAFLLESAPAGSETWARYTFMGTGAAAAWRLSSGVVEDWSADRGWHSPRTPDDPLLDLEERVSLAKPVAAPWLGPFWGGGVGFLGYDVVRYVERLPDQPRKSSAVPDSLFVFTRSVVVIDNLRSVARIVVSVHVDDSTDAQREYRKAISEIDAIESRLRSPGRLPDLHLDHSAAPSSADSSIGRQDFIDKVETIKEYIRAGDCFQALLSRRMETPADFSTSSLYRALRTLNPSPYMYHLTLDGTEIVGSSPELHVRLESGRVFLRPIAGTRPRGATPEDDAAMSQELLDDPKERAEHIMLVDLGRNDVGRVSRYGTVAVTELMKIEKYSHVLHIVSQVEGDLAEGKSWMDVIRATFPAGTMTGAPKVRAMQIIDELEPVSRGAYAGAVGYIAHGGSRIDLAITIRTCVIAGGVASIQAGAGIVADSVPENEWKETENKARAVLTAIAQVRGNA